MISGYEAIVSAVERLARRTSDSLGRSRCRLQGRPTPRTLPRRSTCWRIGGFGLARDLVLIVGVDQPVVAG
jgi:hypothetical protein